VSLGRVWLALPFVAARRFGLAFFALIALGALFIQLARVCAGRAAKKAFSRASKTRGSCVLPPSRRTRSGPILALASQDPLALALWQAQLELTPGIGSAASAPACRPPRLVIHDPWALRGLVSVHDCFLPFARRGPI